MLDRIRRRLTLGYVGIFALILAVLGAAVTASFWQHTSAQQDRLLDQKARGTLDYVSNSLLGYPGGRDPGGRPPEGRDLEEPGRHEEPDGREAPIGPIRSSTDRDIGLVVLAPNEGDAVLESSSSAASLGLPFWDPARKAAALGIPTNETVEGPDGDAMRVVSVPVAESGGGVAVVQAAQPREAVWEEVGDLLLLLASVGLGGLLLAAFGGLFMSRRAMRPIEDSFRRQRAFVADASHELKTPLALVKIGAEILRRDPANPGNAEVVEDQLSEIDRMDALLSNLLTLARLDAGRLDVRDKPFDLAAVAAEAVDRFLKRAAEEGVRIEVEIPDTIPARGDAGRTGQILAVLLDNAVRYTPKGGAVTVFGRSVEGAALAGVADTGPGIPPEHLSRIFDRFYRAEESRTREGGGSGLGLSIARNLARAQEGELSAENAPTGGTVFRLRLPAR